MPTSTSSTIALVIICDGDPTDPQTNSGVARNFIEALAERDDVRIVTSVSSRPPRIVRLMVQAVAFHPSRTRWRQRARRGFAARWARSLTRDLRVRRAAPPRDSVLVHVRSFYAPSRRPYVSFIDTTVLDDDRNWALSEDDTPRTHPRGGLAMERRFYQQAAFVATASRAARDSLLSDYGVEAARAAVIGGGTNTFDAPIEDVHLPVPPRARDRSLQVLFVGRDLRRKGGDLLIEAARRLVEQGVDLHVVVAGCAIDNPPPFVTVTGFLADRAALQRLYASSDVFCLPARWEPYGLVVQEAMAAGLPVVVSDIGELPSIVIDSEMGFVVPTSDSDALARALKILAENPRMRVAFGRNGYIRATTELTWQRVADRFVSRLQDQQIKLSA